MPTDLQLSNGETIRVEESFEDAMSKLQTATGLVEFVLHDESEVRRLGYDDVDDGERVALHPAHVISARSAG